MKYFSAHATWLAQPYARHRAYVDALTARGVEVHLGQFKEKPRRCASCGIRWISHEEKETDVQIAVHMVADALRGEVNRLILISADTDLVPPIKMIASLVPESEVFVATPPGRFGQCRALGPKIEITAGRIAKCLLPAQVRISPDRVVNRPINYDPPI